MGLRSPSLHSLKVESAASHEFLLTGSSSDLALSYSTCVLEEGTAMFMPSSKLCALALGSSSELREVSKGSSSPSMSGSLFSLGVAPK